MKLQFLGAAGSVTGSRTLCSYGSKRILIDCGLYQGPNQNKLNWTPFVEASTIDAVILTHAHIDHSGYLPRLVKEGFRGPIYCSKGTMDLCRILLLDAAHLQEEDAQFANQSGYSNHQPALPLYTTEDANKTLKLFRPLERDRWTTIAPGFNFQLLRSGHIIGSSFIQINYAVENGMKLLTFSGDIGNGRSFTLKPAVNLLQTDYLVLESTYGDREQSRENPQEKLAEIINRVAARKGVLLIPAFAVGRTQEVIFLIRQLEDAGKIPKLPVYLDSPMANHATEIYIKHPEDHQLVIRNGKIESPLYSSFFKPVQSASDSIGLTKRSETMIVVSAAGMLNGGRIMHHLKNRVSDPKNAVLFVGYQAAGTKGRLLQQGLKTIRIHHVEVPVRAEIETIDSLSAHADATDSVNWLRQFERSQCHIFLNHGEPEATLALAEKIKRETKFEVEVALLNKEYKLA